MGDGNAPVQRRVVRRTHGTPSPTKMLLLFGAAPEPHPADTLPHGLLPNMSESSGTLGDNSRGSLASFCAETPYRPAK